MNTLLNKAINEDVKRLGITNCSIHDIFIPLTDLKCIHGTSTPYRRYKNFNPQELIYPYEYNLQVYGASAVVGTIQVEFLLKSACNFNYVKSFLYMNGKDAVSVVGQFNHISMHREFLTMDIDHVHEWDITENRSYIRAAVVRIIEKIENNPKNTTT